MTKLSVACAGLRVAELSFVETDSYCGEIHLLDQIFIYKSHFLSKIEEVPEYVFMLGKLNFSIILIDHIEMLNSKKLNRLTSYIFFLWFPRQIISTGTVTKYLSRKIHRAKQILPGSHKQKKSLMMRFTSLFNMFTASDNSYGSSRMPDELSRPRHMRRTMQCTCQGRVITSL